MYPDTYSQWEEQPTILAYFEARTEPALPRFLDIGAWNPKTFSNTRALFERGWSGVLIEPSPGPVTDLLKEYGNEPRVQIVQGCVGLHHGEQVKLRVTNDSVTAVAGSATNELWKKIGGYYADMTALSISWERINLWWGGFNFVNIDAEGISVELFHAMLGSGQRPECCCVEHDGRMVELGEAATRNAYKMLYSNGTNAVFGL